MTEGDVSKWAKALLLKIHVITGWVIATEDELLAVLIDQFQKHLAEQYGTLNPDEIEYAFRQYGTKTKDWGKAMNLALIDQILLGYLDDRYQVSLTEEKLAIQKLTADNWSAKKHIDWRGQIEDNYQHFINGSKFFVRYPHPFEYDQLEEDGFIEKGSYKVRLRMYQKRLLMSDADMAKKAKEQTVIQLFRMARKMRYPHIYVR